ncbi:MAG TPA: hypothetical protein VHD32_04460 [Candidatus Didemnitutus sp.]|nr:hypothetical protein [Candidatus Didemnitutus sp.]
MALVALLLTGVAAVAWEMHVRALGYAPTLNNNPDLWAECRRAVKPDSVVIIGDSRAWFDMDLDALEQGLGRRPVQLAIPGSCVYPVLEDLANDESFHGTVICSVVPLMYLVPAGRPLQNSLDAVNRYHKQTVAQHAGEHLGMLLEEHIAFLKDDDLTLAELLNQLPIPNRANALIGPPLPPYFSSVDRERRSRMVEACALPGPLQTRVRDGWLPLFTPPPPPTYIPKDVFMAFVADATEKRFHDSAESVRKIKARGGSVVFVRFPVSGALKEHEDRITPRAGPWTRLLKETGAPGIYFEDYPELASFQCPEWSHLSAGDSVEFTRRLVPHLKQALGM